MALLGRLNVNWIFGGKKCQQGKVCLELFTSNRLTSDTPADLPLLPVTSAISNQLDISQCAISFINSRSRSIVSDMALFDGSMKHIQQQIKRYVGEHKLRGYPCEVILPSNFYKLLLLAKPVVNEDELSQALKYRVKDLVVLALDDISVDYLDYPTDVKSADTEMVYAVVASRTLIAQLKKMLGNL